MIAYRPFLAQAPAAVPNDATLYQLIQIQKEIGMLIDGISKGSVDPAKIADIQKKLDACAALGPTPEAVTCLLAIQSEIQALSSAAVPPVPAAAPVWPWIVGGLAVAGVAGYLIFAK